MNKKISAIVSTRNSARFVSGCLDNLLEQTVADDLEVIVIDSASEENEQAIVSDYMKKFSNIRYHRTPQPESLYTSWNRAVKMASGRYIVSANTDDRSRPDAFELMADVLDHNLKAALVYSDVYFTNTANDSMNSSKEKKEHWESCRVPDYSHKELLLRAVCGPRPMWRRNLHDELGFFDESYLVAGDYEFWLRIAERYPLLHLPEFLCLYYLDENCLCLKHQDALQAEHRKIRKKYLNRGERS